MATQKKSDRIRIVLQLAERKEQAAMEVLVRAKSYLDQQLAQQSMLNDYRKQYLEELKGRMQGASSVAQLQSNQKFMQQLDQAIEQQEQVVDHARQAFERAKQSWVDLHEKTKGIKDLYQRFKHEEQIVADKRLEKILEDDYLTRRRFLN